MLTPLPSTGKETILPGLKMGRVIEELGQGCRPEFCGVDPIGGCKDQGNNAFCYVRLSETAEVTKGDVWIASMG